MISEVVRPKQPKRPQRGTLNPPATKRRLGRPQRQITLFIFLFRLSVEWFTSPSYPLIFRLVDEVRSRLQGRWPWGVFPFPFEFEQLCLSDAPPRRPRSWLRAVDLILRHGY